MKLTRRDVLAGTAAAAAVGAVPGPAAAQTRGAGRGVLRVVPHANLQVLDPIFTTGYISRNHGYMIYDTLFALDEQLRPQPQMVESFEVSPDRLRYVFRLRDGLAWHDDTAVTAEDCVASLVRWGKADGMGQRLFAVIDKLEANGAREIVMTLKKPYGLVLDSIGKISSNVPFMMPKRFAETPHTQQLPPDAQIGSGPFQFARADWRPGAVAVYTKNPTYKPRAEPVSAASGGKIAKVDRVEWITMPDPTTAMNALMSGEVDYYEQVPTDLIRLLQAAPGIKVEVLDSIGSLGMARFNHLVAPTNNRLVRRAIMRAINQQEVMQGAIGNPAYGRTCYSVYPCGTPLEATDNADMMRFDQAAARELLRQGGYNNERLVILQPTDIPILSAFSLFTAEACRKVGLNVDLQAMDWSTVLGRRANRGPTDQGGWNIFTTWWIGGDLVNPLTQVALSGAGERAWVGWSTDERIEQLRAAFSEAAEAAQQRKIAGEVQARALEQGFQAYLGHFFVPVGYRETVRGMIRSPVQFFWNMEKLA